MDKLKLHTPDLAEANFRKLAAMFPNAVTETITGYTTDENGREKPIIERAIDADVLRQEISAVVVEGPQERYQFTWPDKKKSVVLANAPIAKTLRLDRSKSVGRNGTRGGIDTENIYIEGDNLDALKLLQETYLGKVKMIYIDPPYNTGNDFIYNDDFSMAAEAYASTSGQLDEEGNRLVPNPETNGRFHTDWLNMIYPRLRIAKDFLSDDGVICISIDNNEIERLQCLCNEVFGTHNFITTITWEKGRKNDSTFYSDSVEYIVIYAKSISTLVSQGPWRAKKEGLDEVLTYYKNLRLRGLPHAEIEKEMQAFYSSLPKDDVKRQMKHFYHSDDRGLFFGADISSASTSIPDYEIIHPVTKRPVKKPSRGWGATEPVMLQRIREERVLFGEDETTIPLKKSYLAEVDSIVKTPVIYKDGRAARIVVQKLLGGNYFDNPKDHLVLMDLISYVLQGEPSSTILDFFSGSATTAHAVMQLNAEDGGNRKFIMVQLPEVCDEKSEARKAGYETICDIGEERIRRAGKKIKEETGADIDYGFRVFRVDSTNMEDVYYTPAETKQDQLDFLAENIKPDRTPEDLLFQVMLDLGILLSSPIEETVIAGKKVFSVADGYLLACFDKNVTEETVTEIAKRRPFYAVFRDSSMAADSVAANFEQIFETYSPKTVRKVL